MGIALYAWSQHSSSTARKIEVQAILAVVARMAPGPRYERQPFHPAPTSYRNEGANTERLFAEKRQREQTAREQAALTDQMRANVERQRQEATKAAGTDYHVPLDEDSLIRDPSGLSARVRVHDNDVTTFDIWIKCALRRSPEAKRNQSLAN